MPSERLALAPGTVLHGTYEIVEWVGAGGMGEVYEARHTRLPGRFAVKVLRVEGRPDESQRARFRREAEIAASLRHPNIVQIIDFNETEGGVPFIAMEFLEGHDLARELARGPLPVSRALAFVEQVASALAAAHGRGVIHRDLKPQNLFVVPVVGQERELVKVLDFGISKALWGGPLTGDRLVGTPRYMAPEQAQSRTAEIDGRTDQFALAAIAYEMLTGRPAFLADDVPSTLYKVVNEQPPPLSAPLPDRGAGLDAVVRRGLAKDRAQRFLSVLEFAGALARAAGTSPGAPISSDPAAETVPSRSGRAATAPARRPAARRVMVVGALAALSIAAYVAISDPDEAAQRPAPPSAVVPEPARAVQAEPAVVPAAPPRAEPPPDEGVPAPPAAAPARKRRTAPRPAPARQEPAPASADPPPPPADPAPRSRPPVFPSKL